MKRSFRIRQLFVILLFAMTLSCSDTDTVGPDAPAEVKEKDVFPPAKITDASLSYADSSGAVLTWTAPRDDAVRDRVESYEIRYSYSFPLNWDLSAPVADPPTPAVEGEVQHHAFDGVIRGRDLYAAIRSYDAAGNVSPMSSVAHVYVDGFRLEGTCYHALTGVPLEGIDAEIIARLVHHQTTAADGTFLQRDLTAGAADIHLTPGSSGLVIHPYRQNIEIEDDMQMSIPIIEYQPAESGAVNSIFELLRIGANTGQLDKRLKKFRRYPIEVYVADFVNGNGLDYAAAARSAQQRWNDATGLEIFQLVQAPPDTGVTVFYRTPSEMGVQIAFTEYTLDNSGFPVHADISIINTFASERSLYVTFLHEFGHAQTIHHLPNGYLMYAGQPLPDDITDDEVEMVRLYTALPNGIDLGCYDVTPSP